jgi:hypothetical protein
MDMYGRQLEGDRELADFERELPQKSKGVLSAGYRHEDPVPRFDEPVGEDRAVDLAAYGS